MTDVIRDYIANLLSDLFYGPFFRAAEWIWNWCMGLCTGIITQSPEAFSSDTWNYVTQTLYPWALGIGVACVNLFFMIGFCRAFMNIKENLTLELFIEAMIRLVAVNALLQVGLPMIRTFFTMSGLLAGQALDFQTPSFYTSDIDLGAHLFWWLFGFGYFLVAFVCAVKIVLTLYGRYIKLYLLVIFYPIALPAILGGRGIENSAYAWVRSFLSNVFEIVTIALVMGIGGRLISRVGVPASGISGFFDGFEQAVNSLIHMVLMTASVSSAASFMNKTFGL